MSRRKTSLEVRRANVASLTLAGATQREIATRLGASLGIVNRDLAILRKRWASERGDLEAQFETDLRRLDDLLGPAYAAAQRGHLQSIDMVLKILDRRARMLGYDAPVKADLTTGGEAIRIVEMRVRPADDDRETDE